MYYTLHRQSEESQPQTQYSQQQPQKEQCPSEEETTHLQDLNVLNGNVDSVLHDNVLSRSQSIISDVNEKDPQDNISIR